MAAWGFRDKQTVYRIHNGGDRLVWNAVVKSRVGRAHSKKPTVNYETAWAGHYAGLGLPIPDFAKTIVWLPEEQRLRLVSYDEYCQLVERGATKSQGY
jgi:hypothetical protein